MGGKVAFTLSVKDTVGQHDDSQASISHTDYVLYGQHACVEPCRIRAGKVDCKTGSVMHCELCCILLCSIHALEVLNEGVAVDDGLLHRAESLRLQRSQ